MEDNYIKKLNNMIMTYNRLLVVLIGIMTLLTAMKEQKYLYGYIVFGICIIISQLHIYNIYVYCVGIKGISDKDLSILSKHFDKKIDNISNQTLYVPILCSEKYSITEKDIFKDKVDALLNATLQQEIQYDVEEIIFIKQRRFLSFKKLKNI